MADAHGPLPRWCRPAAWLLARCYGAAVAWRNARFDQGKGVAKLGVAPVISVGNMTAGGTGKSPFVAWIVGALESLGASSFIAMRGYRASGGRSDEAMEYARSVPRAVVVADPRRREALLACAALAERAATAVVLLDDGFQHRQLARDLDIVLVDATRPGLDGDLLPNGWLREPSARIARADIVVLTKAGDRALREAAAALVARARGRGPDGACDHVWRALEILESGAVRSVEPSWLAGKRVVSACALGNPAHFHDMVERSGAQIAARLEKPDHRPFTAAELEEAAARGGADAVITSRKDMVKLDGAPRSVALVVPELSISFIEGEERVRAAIAACVSARCARSSA